MWSCLLVSDRSPGGPGDLGGVTVLPLDGPAALADHLPQLPPGPVVVAAPAALAGAARTAVTVATGRWPERPLALVVSPHAPLAVLAALTAARHVTDDAARGHALVSALLDRSWSGARLTSVSRLTAPAPSLLQHARSWLPGSRFLVRQHPAPAVLDPGAPDAVPAGSGRRDLLVAGDAAGELIDQISAQGRPATVRPVPLPGTWTSVYGRDDAIQLALVPSDASALLPAVPSGAHPCGQCGLALAAASCPFCHTAGGP
jgi:hypothetical protein